MEITQCSFCGSNEIRVGYQIGDGAIAGDYMGNASSKIIHLVCRNCGAILHSRVEDTSILDEESKV